MTSLSTPLTTSAPASAPSASAPASAHLILPPQGFAKVKAVLSGDTLVLYGKVLQPHLAPPEVLWTLSGISAPRLQSKTNPVDEPGAFAAREWLRQLVVGKTVQFTVVKQGGTSGDRIFGHIHVKTNNPTTDGNNTNTNNNNNEGSADAAVAAEPLQVALELVKLGYATPKNLNLETAGAEGGGGGPDSTNANPPAVADLERQLVQNYHQAVAAKRGIHADRPLVRHVQTAVEDFAVLSLVDHVTTKNNGTMTAVIEHVLDGSRLRAQIVSDGPYQYATVTLLMAGILAPRMGNTKADPPVPAEPWAEAARQFVTVRLLQRQLQVTLVGTDKPGLSAVGMIHHPAGNIAAELLGHGLAKLTDWSVRLLPPEQVPPLRAAEHKAKRNAVGVWKSYTAPQLSHESQLSGQVVEVLSGDTIMLLPKGKVYDSDDALVKVSLASVRAPRVGNERAGRSDEPYAYECKERLRSLLIGQDVKVDLHYEREIPLQPPEQRPFGTIGTSKHGDVAQVLVQEGLAVTQRHRDDEETSPRYDELRAAEAQAKEAKKNMHSENEYKRVTINDLTDPRKAKAYSGSLMRSGKLRAVCDFCFHGALFKVYIPTENCFIRFAPHSIRCPQPSPSPGSKNGKAAEPFGDDAKRHARVTLLQRQIEIDCNGVTNSGIVTGSLFVSGGGGQRRDYALELLQLGLATVDPRKMEYDEAPKPFVDAQEKAKAGKIGVWSLAPPDEPVQSNATAAKAKESVATVRLSEIRSGSHFFFCSSTDNAAKVVEDGMQALTKKHGTAGAPCDAKVGRVVAALFNDGSSKSWYRAKILERKGPSKMSVLYLDHGNVATVSTQTELRPLDVSMGTDRIPPVAKEAVLALTTTRPLNTDEGLDAARMLQTLAWGKDLQARQFALDENGKLAVSLMAGDADETINEQLVNDGLARVGKHSALQTLTTKMADDSGVQKLWADLNVAQEVARKSRSGMWRFGDVGDDDPDDM